MSGITDKPVDGQSVLEQEVEVGRLHEEWSVKLSSRSGKSRNRDYDPALRLILIRLAAVGAVLDAALLDSRTVVGRSEAERLLPISSGYPVRLERARSEELRRLLCEAQAANQFRAPGAKGSGRARKRIELRLTIADEMTVAEFAQLVFKGMLPEGKLVD